MNQPSATAWAAMPKTFCQIGPARCVAQYAAAAATSSATEPAEAAGSPALTSASTITGTATPKLAAGASVQAAGLPADVAYEDREAAA